MVDVLYLLWWIAMIDLTLTRFGKRRLMDRLRYDGTWVS